MSRRTRSSAWRSPLRGSWNSAPRRSWSRRPDTRRTSGRSSSSRSWSTTASTLARKPESRRSSRSRSRPASAGKPTRIVIEDNGPGIPTETIAGIIDYNVRISSREAYISPTRGRQGNALKTILPMAYVLGGKIKGETWIEARGVKHRILFTVNQIKQEPIVKNITSRSRVTTGTRVTVFWPDADEARSTPTMIKDLLSEFIWVNPHLTLPFRVDGKTLIDHRGHQSRLDQISRLRCDLGALVHAGADRALCRGADRSRSGAAARTSRGRKSRSANSLRSSAA